MSVLTAEQERDRADVAERYRWNLETLYSGVAEWRASRESALAEVPRLREYQGRLEHSPQVLADALDLLLRLDETLTRLYSYAGMLADEDTRQADAQGMRQEMQQAYATFRAEAAYVEPEILRLGAVRLEAFLAAEPRLAPCAFYLRDIVRRAPHTLTDAEETLLAAAAPMAATASNVFTILSNADFPYPAITLSDGRTRTVNQAGYAELRCLPTRVDRQAAMHAFFTALGGFGRTFGTTMNGSVQKALFSARARKYESSLEAALHGPNIPASVYARLIDGVHRHLPTLHRYLRLRRRMMAIDDQLHYYDLYAPLVPSIELRFTPEDAQAHILSAMAPLGEGYGAVLREAFRARWIDWFPCRGKRSGAYSNGAAYDVHPYILLNYLGQYTDMSTLAHELGHTMHSFYSNREQPFVTAGYHTFVAEVASTFNEALLIAHMLEHMGEGPARLSLLGSYLESIKSTVFRQTQFAEFEQRMHAMAAEGAAITGDVLAALYLDITRHYYGHEAGVCLVDDEIAHEWSYIPHFYREFYVFQYATSFTAAEALSSKVLAGDGEATARYLTFLGSGGSDYPIELLRRAGVDMTTDEPLDLTMARMNRVMTEIEDVLASRG